MTQMKLFEKLSEVNEMGISRWVYVEEFVGDYEKLKIGNGLSWGRDSSSIAKKYNIRY